MPKICLSRDANRFALAHKGCLEITDSSTNICSVIWECDMDSQTIVDALFVGEDHILITTKSTRTGFVEVRPRKISSNMDGKALVQQEYVSESQVLPLLALSSDGSTIAIMTQSKVEFWLTEKWEQRMPIQCREGASGKSRALALSGHHVLVGLKLKPMKSSNGARKGSVRIKFDGKIVCAAFSADGNLLAVAGEYSISIYSSLLAQSPLPGLLLPIVIATSSPLDRIVLSPRAQYLAATGVCSLTVWKVPSDTQTAREPLMTLQSSEPQRQMLSAVVFPKDDRYLHCAHVCSGSRDICFGIRDMEVPSSAQMPVSALTISSDGKVATGSISGFVAVWNPTMRKVLPTWQMKDRHLGPVISLAFSPDDEYLASVSEKVVHITSAAGEVLKLRPSDGRFHFPCAFSGSSAFFLCTVKPASGAAFARIVDIRSNQARDIHADNFDFVENVHSIALSASADMLAINTTAGWLYLYRLLGSAATTRYRKQLGLLDCLSFTLDDQHVRSAVGAFSVDQLKPESSLRAPTVCVRDGWLVDSNGNLTCSLPSEEIDQWASNASTLVFCTKTLGDIVLVSIRSFEEGFLE
ncbi:hypothetical protein D9757_006891 [Collybiopsis confluens]|uniref:Uncharacterized protein n=1 Tax=Collybiopsis confluens TaxID=2823264 RepID=A0A8H5HPV0_9AGAR|nr:hypothetical protein D9757_006891 [Collybiopsis confluens]